MPDFLLELLTEEIPARMQAAAADQLRARFGDGIKGQLPGGELETHVTPRRLILYARGLGAQGNATEEERRGPKAEAPAQAIEGFLRSTGLSRDQLEERDTPKGKFLYAMIRAEGRSAAAVIAELIPQIVRDFDWLKSMRWGDASITTSSPRWVRPLSSIVALLDDQVVAFEAAGIASGRTTRGHRFMSSGSIEIFSAATYAAQLREAHVLVDAAERRSIVLDGARAAAAAHGLTLVEDAGLVAENAGLTEWPVPLLGAFDPAFLDVPREVIQLTMRTNQKYFACVDAQGALAPAFVCVANLVAPDGGEAIIAGNRKVLAARLSDAKFFWDQDRAVTLEARLPKLANIVFHEKLGTVADKVERVAKLARWLVESGAVKPEPQLWSVIPANAGTQSTTPRDALGMGPGVRRDDDLSHASVARLADLAEQAARLCKADLVSATVGEFPEVQGIAGRYLALAEGLPPEVADAIRDHYKPVGQGDDVPTAPVSVAVALADRLDTLAGFFLVGELPTGSKDPFALRRAMLGSILHVLASGIRMPLSLIFSEALKRVEPYLLLPLIVREPGAARVYLERVAQSDTFQFDYETPTNWRLTDQTGWTVGHFGGGIVDFVGQPHVNAERLAASASLLKFALDRLKVQQREAGIRPDIIDAVFALGGEDDLVRLLARVRALQAFIDTDDGTNLLAGYKRAANILRIEEAKDGPFDDAPPHGSESPEETALAAATARVIQDAAAAVAAEDFAAAMHSLASLRAPIDAFFTTVMVNDPDPDVRRARLALLARFRQAAHTVADFSKIA